MSDNNPDVQDLEKYRKTLDGWHEWDHEACSMASHAVNIALRAFGIIEQQQAQLDAKDTEIATKDAQIAERNATIAKMTDCIDEAYGNTGYEKLFDCLQSLKEPNT